MDHLTRLLLNASDRQVSTEVKSIIEKWEVPAKAIEILEALDMAVHTGGASNFVITVLEALLDAALKIENCTYESLLTEAIWRK